MKALTAEHFALPSRLVAASLLAVALAGQAQTKAPAGQAAVAQAIAPQAFVQSQWQRWFLPRSAAFVQAADALQQAMQQHCGGAPKLAAQQRWRDALLAWDSLSAVAVGPLIVRRSVRRIDFMPTRPELIQKAITAFNPDGKRLSPGENEAALERVGSAARGFAALEWLLWTQPGAKLDAPSCRFAVALSADLVAEGSALQADFQSQATAYEGQTPNAARLDEGVSELLNQWIGGLEQLRLQSMERAMHDAENRDPAKPQYGRVASGTSLAERQTRWAALRTLAVVGPAGSATASPGLLSIEAYLRGEGRKALADQLAGAVRAADQALAEVRDNSPAKLRPAARRLVELTALMQGDVASALGVTIGFSDADGD